MMHRHACFLILGLVPGCLDDDPALAIDSAEVAVCTHHVATSGNDANPGTSAAPWRTIQHAVGTGSPVGPGAVVCVAPGTYHENVVFGVSGAAGAPITLMGLTGIASGPGALIDGTRTEVPYGECPPALTIHASSSIRLTNLAFTHHGVPGYTANYCTSTGIRIGSGLTSVDDIEIDHVKVSGIRTAYGNALGVPIGVASYRSDVLVSHVRITDSVFSDNDTIAESILFGSGAGSVALQVSAVNFAGNTRDWLVARNVFDDNDSGGVELGGNQSNSLQPTGGVISDNRFVQSGRYGASPTAAFPSAVYNQGGRRILIERNFFDHPGHAINVKTEPMVIQSEPLVCGSAVPATHTWIRNNIIVGARGADLLTGANDNGSTFCNYGDVDGVYVTNNTIVRDNGNTAAFDIVKNPYAGLIGDNKFADNIVITPGSLFHVTGNPPFASDFNYLVSSLGAPFDWNGPRTWAYWQGFHDQSSQISSAVAPNVFAVNPPTQRADFALSATVTPPHDNGAPYTPFFGTRPTTPGWAAAGFGAYTPATELDHFGGAREPGGKVRVVRRDIGADER